MVVWSSVTFQSTVYCSTDFQAFRVVHSVKSRNVKCDIVRVSDIIPIDHVCDYETKVSTCSWLFCSWLTNKNIIVWLLEAKVATRRHYVLNCVQFERHSDNLD